jgi:uncharacterized protein (DUF2235 family)
VWDTVASVGWIYNPVQFPFTRATKNPDLNIVRHAVSIDERRAFYRPSLFGKPHDARQDVMEAWFAGVHSDVGGSYPESESQLSKIALRWMLCEAERAGLKLDPDHKADILDRRPPYVAPDPSTKNQHESLHGLWWLAELWPKIVSRQTHQGAWYKTIRVNLGRRRFILPGSLLHESVEQRLNSTAYKPSNLPENPRIVGDRCL